MEGPHGIELSRRITSLGRTLGTAKIREEYPQLTAEQIEDYARTIPAWNRPDALPEALRSDPRVPTMRAVQWLLGASYRQLAIRHGCKAPTMLDKIKNQLAKYSNGRSLTELRLVEPPISSDNVELIERKFYQHYDGLKDMRPVEMARAILQLMAADLDESVEDPYASKDMSRRIGT